MDKKWMSIMSNILNVHGREVIFCSFVAILFVIAQNLVFDT